MKKLDLSIGTVDRVLIETEEGEQVDMQELGPEDFKEFMDLMQKLRMASKVFDGNGH